MEVLKMEIRKEFDNYTDFINFIKENKIARMQRINDKTNNKIILIYNK
jgi:hypothetical protein